MFKKILCGGKDNLEIAKKALFEKKKKEFRASLVFFLLILRFKS